MMNVGERALGEGSSTIVASRIWSDRTEVVIIHQFRTLSANGLIGLPPNGSAQAALEAPVLCDAEKEVAR